MPVITDSGVAMYLPSMTPHMHELGMNDLPAPNVDGHHQFIDPATETEFVEMCEKMLIMYV